MGLPAIDINALPLLDTAVGLFGSLVAQTKPGSATFEVTVTVVLIIYGRTVVRASAEHEQFEPCERLTSK